MIYRLSHTTTYQYGGTVSLSHHFLRLQPRELVRQRCLNNELQIEPRPDVICPHLDYFGNPMTFVTIEGSHRRLVITSHSEVEVAAPVVPEPAKTPPWESVRGLSGDGNNNEFLDTCEFTYASPLIKKLREFRAYAVDSFPAGRPLLAAVLDLTARMHTDFKFDSTATNVATPLTEVFKGGAECARILRNLKSRFCVRWASRPAASAGIWKPNRHRGSYDWPGRMPPMPGFLFIVPATAGSTWNRPIIYLSRIAILRLLGDAITAT